jgi:hypothetical protein
MFENLTNKPWTYYLANVLSDFPKPHVSIAIIQTILQSQNALHGLFIQSLSKPYLNAQCLVAVLSCCEGVAVWKEGFSRENCST